MKAIYKTASPYCEDALNLPVKNLEDALSFYQSVMGFQIAARQDARFDPLSWGETVSKSAWPRTVAILPRKAVSSRWMMSKLRSLN